MKEFIRKNLLIIIFSITGAIGGFLYWKFIGCLSGSCPIKSVWYLSTLWGLALGYLAGSIVKDILVKLSARKKIAGDVQTDEKQPD